MERSPKTFGPPFLLFWIPGDQKTALIQLMAQVGFLLSYYIYNV